MKLIVSPKLSTFPVTGMASVPLDSAVWATACAVYRHSIRGIQDKVEAWAKHDWPSLPNHMGADGRLSPTWESRGGTTRIVSHDPYVQGIPKGPMRQAVRADGSLIVCADWKSSHLRILADLSGDKALLQDILHGDPYGEIAGLLGLDPVVDRKRVKEATLAALNGQGMRSRWQNLPYKAHLLEPMMRGRWPEALAYCDAIVTQAKRDACILTTPAGTTVEVPSDKLYAAMAYWLQAIEADALRRAVEEIHHLWGAGLPLQPILLLHDEIVVEATDPSRVGSVVALVRDVMSRALGLSSDLQRDAVEVTWGPSWGQQDETTVHSDIPIPDGVTVPDHTPDSPPWAYIDVQDRAFQVVSQARQRASELRVDWGPAHRKELCSSATLRAKGGEGKGKYVHFGIRCKSPACSWCGPYEAALAEGAMVSMPMVSGDKVIGRSMGERRLYLYRFPATWKVKTSKTGRVSYTSPELKAFIAAMFKKVSISPIGKGGNRRDCHLFTEAPGYLAFHLRSQGELAILTTVPEVYSREHKPVAVINNILTIQSLVAETLKPWQPQGRFGSWQPRGHITSSNSIHLDTRSLVSQAQETSYRRLPGAPGPSPAKCSRIQGQAGIRHKATSDGDGVVTTVETSVEAVTGNEDRYLAMFERGISPEEQERRVSAYQDSIGATETTWTMADDDAATDQALMAEADAELLDEPPVLIRHPSTAMVTRTRDRTSLES